MPMGSRGRKGRSQNKKIVDSMFGGTKKKSGGKKSPPKKKSTKKAY